MIVASHFSEVSRLRLETEHQIEADGAEFATNPTDVEVTQKQQLPAHTVSNGEGWQEDQATVVKAMDLDLEVESDRLQERSDHDLQRSLKDICSHISRLQAVSETQPVQNCARS